MTVRETEQTATKAVRPYYLPPPFQDSADHGRLILRDGTTATLRVATLDDYQAMRDFYARLSPQSRRMRFFTENKPGEDSIRSACDSTDPSRQLTLVVLRHGEQGPRIVASGSYFRHTDHSAEFAVAVEDGFQGKGIGGLLLERLSVLASARGFTHFMAVTHPANRSMLDTFRSSGFQLREQHEDGCVEVDLEVSPRAESVAHSEMRDRLYTHASIRPFFNPKAVAVIGASRDPEGIGHRLLENLVHSRFNGPVYPVNPHATVISSIRAHASILDIPDDVDLAVIAVPHEQVPAIVDECAAKGVRALIVISSGYAEIGTEGRERQEALLEQVRGHGMRMVGPNCLGLMNNDPGVRLNATFVAEAPPPGRIALSSQSGALGLAILTMAHRRDLGLSSFISMGNKADVTGNDLLNYWEDDPGTDVILLYLESFGNPRRFARIARRVSRHKPIVCVKSGRFRSYREPMSMEETAVAALFRQTGIIRAETLEEMFDVAALLGNQPLPRGRRTGIITNSRGSGVLCMDACSAGGLEVAALSPESLATLQGSLPPYTSTQPILDLTANAEPAAFRAATEAMLNDPGIDNVIILFIPVQPVEEKDYTHAIRDGLFNARNANGAGKPVATVMMTDRTRGVLLPMVDEHIPCYAFPETAAHALGLAAAYSDWRTRPPGMIPDFEEANPDEARRIAAEAGTADVLPPDKAEAFLRAFGIHTPPADGDHPVPAATVGIRHDPKFGPLIFFAEEQGGSAPTRAAAHRVTPLTIEEAATMTSGPAWERSQLPPESADAVQELLLRLSLMAEELPELGDLRIGLCPGASAGDPLRRCNIMVSPKPVSGDSTGPSP